ncbi:GNAT family N-acetyltransferase [Undibacterium sp. TJN19]|uniref:GNAT family N-acetyltransferase n=1 Tax=Undibacterium sp. TJN19 TaxID=3413055 RepID=UPI003BF37D32
MINTLHHLTALNNINTPDAAENASPLKICRQQADADKANIVLYAFLDQQHVGALDCSILEQQIDVHVLYVRPAYRQQGIAKALLASLCHDFPGREIHCQQQHI